jgi:hypothetical protein
MTCIPISNGFLCVPRTNFKCPVCKKKYSDSEEKYFNRCVKNKKDWTKIKCSCGVKFGFTYDYKGNATSFTI